MPSCTIPGTTTPTAATECCSANSAASDATALTTAFAVSLPSAPCGVVRRARVNTVRSACPVGVPDSASSRAALISVPPTSTASSVMGLATGTDLAPYRPLWSIPMGQSRSAFGRSGGGAGHDLLESFQRAARGGFDRALRDVGRLGDLRLGQIAVIPQHKDLALARRQLGQRADHGLVFGREHGEALRGTGIGRVRRGVVARGLAPAQHAA